MSFNLIKLKKVPGKVSFDLKPKEGCLRTQSRFNVIKKVKRNQTTLPVRSTELKMGGKSVKGLVRVSAHHKTAALMIKRITADIVSIGNDIDNLLRPSPFKPVDNIRKSVTPPSILGYKVTKQSFPNYEIKLPKF